MWSKQKEPALRPPVGSAGFELFAPLGLRGWPDRCRGWRITLRRLRPRDGAVSGGAARSLGLGVLELLRQPVGTHQVPRPTDDEGNSETPVVEVEQGEPIECHG